MAVSNFNPADHAANTLLKVEPDEPLFRPFERSRVEIDKAQLPGGAVRDFADRVADVTAGARIVIDLAMDDDLRRQNRADADTPSDDHRPLLSPNDVWSLQRLAMAALHDLETEAERITKWAFEYHTNEGAAERVRDAGLVLRSEGGRYE